MGNILLDDEGQFLQKESVIVSPELLYIVSYTHANLNRSIVEEGLPLGHCQVSCKQEGQSSTVPRASSHCASLLSLSVVFDISLLIPVAIRANSLFPPPGWLCCCDKRRCFCSTW